MSVAVEHAGIDYHVVLAQNALQQCLEVAELQDELVSCLVKQTSRHLHTKHGVQVTKDQGRASPSTPRMHLKLKNVSAWMRQ